MSFYITTPIYYANDRLHIGHGYTTVTADILARFHRLAGEDTFFLTGMDEHGSKIAEAAKATGKTPQQLCDENYKLFMETFKVLGISNDDFIRTTSKRHERGIKKLLTTLYDARTPSGESVIYKGIYEGFYCTGCEKFITEKELTDDGLCPDHLVKPKKLSEKNYFFRLSAYIDQVEELIKTNKIKIMPEGRRKEVLGLIAQKLDDFSISRERVAWGIELPFDPSQNVYVWVDALPNYITAIGYADDREKFDKWWNKSRVVQLMAKDILKFHAIYWPAMLLAAGERVPDMEFIHGYISIDGQKISKSLGNVISNERLVEEFGRDAARFLLVSQFPFHQDGDISYSKLYEKYNSNLANDYGNLVSRVTKMIIANFDGMIPQADDGDDDSYSQLKELIQSTSITVMEQIRNIDIHGAIETTWGLIRATNRYFDYSKPWELAKQGKKSELGIILYRCLNAVRIVATLTMPIMPRKSQDVLSLLGYPDDYQPSLSNLEDNPLKPGTKLVPRENIFPRLKVPKSKQATKEESIGEGIVTIDDFAKIKLKVAEVLTCERVPDADKLLKLQIAIGNDKRQIVAGVAQFYEPEQLIGRKIIVVSNLQKTKIRGIESQGMLLAATKGKKLSLVTLDSDLPSGASIS